MKLRDRFSFLGEAHWIFVVICLVFGVGFVALTPPFWGTDETSHFARVYQISQGEMISTSSKGVLPKTLVSFFNYSIGDLVDNVPTSNLHKHEVDSVQKYDQLDGNHFSKTQSTYNEVALYAPLAYAGSIVGVLLAELFHATIGVTLYAARVGSLLLYVAIVGVAIWLMKNYKMKWLVFVVGLLPSSVFHAATVTADNMVIGLSLLFIATLFHVLWSKEKSLNRSAKILMIICAIVLPIVKENYIFLSLAILFIPNIKLSTSKIQVQLMKYVTLAVAVVASVGWLVVGMSHAVDPTSSPRPDGLPVNLHGQLVFVIGHPISFVIDFIRTILLNIDQYTVSATAMIGWNYVTPPSAVITFIIIGIFVAALYAKKEFILLKRQLIYLTVLSCIGILSIFGIMYVSFTPVGKQIIDGVQGRYFIPFIIPLAAIIVAYLPVDLTMSKKTAQYLFPIFSVFCLLVMSTYYVLSL